MAVELYYSGIEKSVSRPELPVSYHDEVHEELKIFESAAIEDPRHGSALSVPF